MPKKRWLTAEDRVRIAEYRAHWLDEGFETAPADRDAARQAIDWIYRKVGLGPPRIVWCGSPRAMLVAANIVISPAAHTSWFGRASWRATRDLVGPEVKHSVETLVEWSLPGIRPRELSRELPSHRDAAPFVSVARPFRRVCRDSLSAPVTPCVEDGVVEAARSALGLGPVFRPLREWIWQAMLDHPFVGHQRLRDVVASVLLGEMIHGQHNADWVGLCDYFYDICALPAKGAIYTAYGQLAASAGWLLPRADICWICERPSVARRDDSGVLHSGTGPALVYRDGWELHFSRGVYMPRHWIERAASLDLEFVYQWRQPEQRRLLAELAGGWQLLLSRVQVHVVDEDADPSIGALLEWRSRGGPARFLRVLCGTGRSFVLPVPPNCTTARQANAWTYGLAAPEYELEART